MYEKHAQPNFNTKLSEVQKVNKQHKLRQANENVK